MAFLFSGSLTYVYVNEANRIMALDMGGYIIWQENLRWLLGGVPAGIGTVSLMIYSALMTPRRAGRKRARLRAGQPKDPYTVSIDSQGLGVSGTLHWRKIPWPIVGALKIRHFSVSFNFNGIYVSSHCPAASSRRRSLR